MVCYYSLYGEEKYSIQDDITGICNLTLYDIDFTRDCDKASRFLVEVIRQPSFEWNELNATIYPYAALIEVLRAVSPDPFANVTKGKIIDWFDSLQMANVPASMFNAIIDKCGAEICHRLAWKGNADLAGIGIFISYLIEVLLTTLFLFLFSTFHLLHPRSYGRPISVRTSARHPLWAALQTSLGLFWDTALLFGLAVATAAVVVDFTIPSDYNEVMVNLSSVIVTSSVLATWPLYLPTCRHRTVRWVGLSVVCTLQGVVGIREVSRTSRAVDGSPFEEHCFPGQGADLEALSALLALGLGGFSLLVVGGYVAAWVWTVIAIGTRRDHGSGTEPGLWIRLVMMGWSLVSFAFMWFAMAVLVLLRRTVEERAGPSIEEGEWGFGQILALATWLPTALDFVVVLRGSLKALEYRLPRGILVGFEEDEEHMEGPNEKDHWLPSREGQIIAVPTPSTVVPPSEWAVSEVDIKKPEFCRQDTDMTVAEITETRCKV